MLTVKMNAIIAQRGDNLAELTAGKYVTHIAPDLDAITSVVLHRLQSMAWRRKAPDEVVLVPQGTPASAMLAAFGLFDIGGVFDPHTIRYDHHGVANLPRGLDEMEDGVWSAAGLVLNQEIPEFAYATGALGDFVRLVTVADNGLRSHGAGESWERGVHALYGLWRSERLPDAEMWARMEKIVCQVFSSDGRESLEYALSVALEPYADDLVRWHSVLKSAENEIKEKQVYEGDRIVALMNASKEATDLIFARGDVDLVVFHNDATLATGIQRRGEVTTPNVGELVTYVGRDLLPTTMVAEELATWWKDSAFFSGTSEKAKNTHPLLADLVDIARAIDTAWLR